MASSWIATCSGFSLEDDIEGEETRSLLSRIHHDHSVEWDGPNHFGNLDDDAQAARVELESALRELDQEDYWIKHCAKPFEP